ncbi:MAG: DUF4430 domain-containing protein [Rubripirellula sp.]
MLNYRPAMCLLMLSTLGCGVEQPAARVVPVVAPPNGAASSGTVTVQVEVGDQTQTFEVPDVADGTTLEAVMQAIEEIPITMHGSGVTAFVEAIDGKSTTGDQGWTFKIDDKFANQGVGSTALTPPTTVTWSYGGMQSP